MILKAVKYYSIQWKTNGKFFKKERKRNKTKCDK